MTAHRWEHFEPEDKMLAMSTYGSRRCLLCGAEQHKEDVQWWGRITGYRWYPLAGRCPGVHAKAKQVSVS